MSIKGPIPDGPLYRFFSKEEYTSAFIEGEIRFGWLGKYSQMEGDIREDLSDGRAEYEVDVHNQLTLSIDRTTGKEIGKTIKPGTTKR